jgi:2-polyprenyl-3-methyl-5-hydroxy-6-metoxy-1,4-benzoquinol methylase
MADYLTPNKAEWTPEDPRQKLDAFDEEAFRVQYNAWMPREQPVLSNTLAALSPIDKIICERIAAHGKRDFMLEIGCGNGRVSISLLVNDAVDELVMIDISDEMARNAEETAALHGVNPIVLRSSLSSFQWQTLFDIVLAQEVLEHLFNVHEGLAKIADLLLPGGLFLGTVPKLHTCDAVVHLHYFTRESLEHLLCGYFDTVLVSEIDATGQGQIHLLFFAEGRKG